MARNPADQAIADEYASEFAARAAQLGAAPADLSDTEFHNLCNEVLRNNLGVLYNQALQADGLAVDASGLPGWRADLAAAGATPRDAVEFARGLYPDLHPDEAVRRYQRDIARASGATVPEPPQPLFDRVF